MIVAGVELVDDTNRLCGQRHASEGGFVHKLMNNVHPIHRRQSPSEASPRVHGSHRLHSRLAGARQWAGSSDPLVRERGRAVRRAHPRHANPYLRTSARTNASSTHAFLVGESIMKEDSTCQDEAADKRRASEVERVARERPQSHRDGRRFRRCISCRIRPRGERLGAPSERKTCVG